MTLPQSRRDGQGTALASEREWADVAPWIRALCGLFALAAVGVISVYVILAAGSDPIWAVLSIAAVFSVGVLVAVLERQVVERAEATAALARQLADSNSLLRATMESNPDGVVVLDRDGAVIEHNANFLRMWGIDGDILDGGSAGLTSVISSYITDPDALAEILAESTVKVAQETVHHVDGRVISCEAVPLDLSCAPHGGIAISFEDVTSGARQLSSLRDLAYNDPLTGLHNRRRFDQAMDEELAHVATLGRPSSVVVLDLDGIKAINDSQGHSAGDAILASVASRITEVVRSTDLVARVGGDEFALLLPGADAGRAQASAEIVLGAIRDHRAVVDGVPLRVTASAGVAEIDPRQDARPSDAYERADAALYKAKEGGRDRAVVAATGRAFAGTKARTGWPERIRQALASNSFQLNAQPIVDLRTGEVAMHEMLLRLVGDGGELIPPSAFLPAAERSGLVRSLDTWVACTAVEEIARQRDRGRDLTVSVNLSAATLGEGRLITALEDTLADTGVSPHQLIFEITESAAVTNMDEARDFAERISGLGCRIALDDFGAGFGSFYYLKHLPLDFLKIDGDFVQYLGMHLADQAIVQAIVDLATRLGKQTIAEFVGDDRTRDALRAFGVDYGQGNHLGLPRPLSTPDWPIEASQQLRRDRIRM